MSAPTVNPPAPAGENWTVRRILDWTIPHLKSHGSESPRLDAEILLAHARGCPRIQLYTNYDQPLTDEQRAVMRDLVKRRAAAEPVAYLVGHREFFGLDFRVDFSTKRKRFAVPDFHIARENSINRGIQPHLFHFSS